ncbi:MAG: esterase-like activity of phytase family protein [Chitinophagaceae bacterium]|nr:esterase-like activity of phytase family protein [Chitinophagaceae bacterium]
MYYYFARLLVVISISQLLFSCTAPRHTMQGSTGVTALRYLGGYEISFDYEFNGTTVGGLSGIDYDAKNNAYYLISDDRSERSPARFYQANIWVSPKGIDSLVFTDVRELLQPDGKTYPNDKEDRFKTPDPEAIRYNPVLQQLVWTSEGERIINSKDTVLVDPAVIIMDTGGMYIDRFALPSNLFMQPTEKGPRRNAVLEGMSFADNFKTLYVSVEEPLYEDGPRAEVFENNAFIRIIRFDVAGKKSIAQYAYKLEPVAFKANPESAFKINGVPDILSLGNNRLLVVERSFSTGRLQNTIKVFVADLNGATDISQTNLAANPGFKPAVKKEVLNMDDLGIYIDNIEGVTFGPLLPNGHKTLLFIADNNFNDYEKSQVLLFEIME